MPIWFLQSIGWLEIFLKQILKDWWTADDGGQAVVKNISKIKKTHTFLKQILKDWWTADGGGQAVVDESRGFVPPIITTSTTTLPRNTHGTGNPNIYQNWDLLGGYFEAEVCLQLSPPPCQEIHIGNGNPKLQDQNHHQNITTTTTIKNPAPLPCQETHMGLGI